MGMDCLVFLLVKIKGPAHQHSNIYLSYILATLLCTKMDMKVILKVTLAL